VHKKRCAAHLQILSGVLLDAVHQNHTILDHNHDQHHSQIEKISLHIGQKAEGHNIAQNREIPQAVAEGTISPIFRQAATQIAKQWKHEEGMSQGNGTQPGGLHIEIHIGQGQRCQFQDSTGYIPQLLALLRLSAGEDYPEQSKYRRESDHNTSDHGEWVLLRQHFTAGTDSRSQQQAIVNETQPPTRERFAHCQLSSFGTNL